MRKIGPRVAAAGVSLLALVGQSIGSAQGDGVIETYYASPVTYVAPARYVATSQVVSTGDTFVVPTGYSYVLPASYAASAYSTVPAVSSYDYAPATYVSARYRRRGLLRRVFNRPVIETSRTYAYDVTPTVMYQPTTITYDAPATVASGYYATACQESAVAFRPPGPVPGNAVPADGPGASGTITSTAKRPEEQNYYGKDAPRSKDAAKEVVRDVPKDPAKDATKDGGAAASPPSAPAAPVRDPDGSGSGTGGMADPDPLIPPRDVPKGADSVSTRNFRFPATVLRARDTAPAVNVLRGQVVLATQGLADKPVPQVRVVFVDAKNRFPDRIRMTDAKGAFEVFLPDGGWNIQIDDPAAPAGTKPRVFTQITSASGRYFDDQDSPIYSVRINY